MNFNPINCWPTSILDLIFQNLSGDEILTATKVSPSWENYIGRSSICMRKIDLKIIGRKFYLNGQYEELKGELQKLAKSGRRYENLNFYAHKPGFLTNAVLRLLKSQKGNWKSVKIWSEKFYDEHEMEKVLSFIDESVEYLEFRNISFVQSSLYFKAEKFLFRKLKSLSLCNISDMTEFFKRSFTICQHLESLEIENLWSSSILDFIASKTNLQRLSINEEKWKTEIFSHLSRLPSAIKFKEFRMKTSTTDCQIYRNCFNHFMNIHTNDVTKLILDLPLDFELLQSVLKLRTLETLHLSSSISHELINLPKNPSIIELHINFVCYSKIVMILISSMPNLKRVKLCSASETFMSAIKNELPYLETIETYNKLIKFTH